MDIARLFKPPDMLSREDGAARGSAARRIAEGMRKEDALASDPIECGRFDHGITHRPRMEPRLVVGNAEENVGAFIRQSRSDAC